MYKAKKQSTGEILVEVSSQDQADKLFAQTRIADLAIRVTPHRSLNSSQGVISQRDLLNGTDADLLEGLRSQGGTAVRRITIRIDEKQIPTKHIILTFDKSTIPEYINAGNNGCSVRPYIPNPRRCFKYQRFGHGTDSWFGRLTCPKYALHDHPAENWNVQQFLCVNCQGTHAA